MHSLSIHATRMLIENNFPFFQSMEITFLNDEELNVLPATSSLKEIFLKKYLFHLLKLILEINEY
ncbi:MAG: hypothetical protein ACTSQJ_05210 [Promethearchaeota archaeon]